MEENAGREIAFMLDEDGITTEELRTVLAGMAEEIKSGNDTSTMLDNYQDLRDAERELRYWEGTAAEHEAAPAPGTVQNPLTAKLYIIDDNRKGVAREQVLQVVVGVLDVMCKDLEENGFCRVATITDESVTSRSSIIFYKPSHSDFVTWEEHVDIVGTLIQNTYRRG